jgi:hypothetical protein
MIGREKTPQVIELEEQPHTMPKQLQAYPFSKLEIADDGSEVHLFSKDGVDWEDKTAELEKIVEDHYGHKVSTWQQATGGATEKRKLEANVTKWLRSNGSQYLEAQGNTPKFVIRAMEQAIALKKAEKQVNRLKKRESNLRQRSDELEKRLQILEAKVDQTGSPGASSSEAETTVSYVSIGGRLAMVENGEVVAIQEKILFDPIGGFLRRRQEKRSEDSLSSKAKPKRRITLIKPVLIAGGSDDDPAPQPRQRVAVRGGRASRGRLIRRVNEEEVIKGAPEERSIWGPVAAAAAVGALALSALGTGVL